MAILLGKLYLILSALGKTCYPSGPLSVFLCGYNLLLQNLPRLPTGLDNDVHGIVKTANYRRLIPSLLAGLIVLAACDFSQPAATQAAPTPQTPSAIPDTPSGEPSTAPSELAALVNGEAVLLPDFEANLARFQAAQTELGTLLATEDASARVLADMIDRLLLAQGARQEGFVLDESSVAERVNKLEQQAGGAEAFAAWMDANFYTPESFRRDLALEMEAAWMRQQILAALPETAEQVLARQVLFYTPFEADRVYDQLESGTPFDTIVTNNDPDGLGYLGWFPRGYLLDPELEEAAFALQPGQYSPVIQTKLGYHILQVLDRDPARPLSPDARLVFSARLLEQWLADKRTQSQIQNLLP